MTGPLTVLDGCNGFRIDGAAPNERLGTSVAAAGDLNGDGFDDVIVGAPFRDYDSEPGHAYVIYGKASGFAATLNASSLDGTNGFALTGDASERTGFRVDSAGDVNADGAQDLIVGSWSGNSHVVLSPNAPADPKLNIIGTNGFDVLRGSQSDDTLIGQNGNDRLYAFAGDDVLNGGKGDDVPSGGAGDDALIGGIGTDTAYYATDTAAVRASLATGKASGASTGQDSVFQVENLTGTSFNDVLTGDGGANVPSASTATTS